MFVNWVYHDTVLINNPAGGGADVNFHGSKSDTGLSGVIDASLMCRVRQGNWELIVGYRVLLLSGLAKAAEQFDFAINEDPEAVTRNVNHQGTSVLHGPFVGAIYNLP